MGQTASASAAAVLLPLTSCQLDDAQYKDFRELCFPSDEWVAEDYGGRLAVPVYASGRVKQVIDCLNIIFIAAAEKI